MAVFNIERIKDIVNLTRILAVKLRDLRLEDNFKSFEASIEIPAGTEAKIRNLLNSSLSKYIITSQTGAGQVTKGTSPWTSDYVYLYNNGGSAVTITVTFLI